MRLRIFVYSWRMGLKSFEMANNYQPKQPQLLFPFEEVEHMISNRKQEIFSEKEKLANQIIFMRDQLIQRKEIDI
jgi:hypothetical protein